MPATKQCEWAFNLSEYQHMFDLKDAELGMRILDFPGSMSCFNAKMHEKGYRVVSGDPSYEMSKSELENHVGAQLQELGAHLAAHKDKIADTEHTSAAIMAEAERNSCCFVSDYEKGVEQGRYVAMSMPRLPYEDYSFDLALCSHWLFSENPDSYFQIQMIKELVRVAGELRIYPLLGRDSEPSPSIGPVMVALQQENYGVELREVSFELKKEGNAMLRVWARECRV